VIGRADTGGEFRVNTYTTGDQSEPAVAIFEGGSFVVVWTSGQDGSGSGVFAQRYAAGGAPLGPEFRVNTFTTGSQDQPRVAAGGAGEFMVVWTSEAQDGSGPGVFGQRYAAPIGIAHMSLDGRWLRVNRRLCDITGYSPDELTRLTLRDLTHPEAVEADLAMLGRLLEGKVRSCSSEKRYVRKDGTFTWINLTRSVVRVLG